MTPAQECSLCGQFRNELGEHDICKHCEAEIVEKVRKWLPVLEELLVRLEMFDSYCAERRQRAGLTDADEPPPRRSRDLPDWITW